MAKEANDKLSDHILLALDRSQEARLGELHILLKEVVSTSELDARLKELSEDKKHVTYRRDSDGAYYQLTSGGKDLADTLRKTRRLKRWVWLLVMVSLVLLSIVALVAIGIYQSLNSQNLPAMVQIFSSTLRGR